MALTKKAITFGLVHIPIELNPVIRNNDTAFNQLHKKCGSRIKYQKICPVCEKEVSSSEIIKGYEYTPDEYVTFSDEDFDKLQLCDNCPIEIIGFVKESEIDPIYYEKSYYLTSKGSNRAFNLFKVALKKSNKVALTKTVIGTKFYYAILRFQYSNIILNTLYFNEEVNLDEETKLEKFNNNEVELAIKLIDAMSSKFEPDKYKDEYQDRLKEAIEQKVEGKEIVAVKSERQETVVDLMKALEMSLNNTK